MTSGLILFFGIVLLWFTVTLWCGGPASVRADDYIDKDREMWFTYTSTTVGTPHGNEHTDCDSLTSRVPSHAGEDRV